MRDAVLATSVGVVAVLAVPVAIGAVGFGAGGIVAGSIAAAIQGPATVVGSTFALTQSAGVLGLAATTKVAMGTVASGIAYIGMKL